MTQDDREGTPPGPLAQGTPAPPFRLPSDEAAAAAPGSPVPPAQCRSLDELRGAPAVLVFYPGDFTPVCGEELSIFSELLPDLEALGARVLGISVDSVWSHRAFARERHIAFPLLSDAHPRGAVARRYGCYREEDGLAERATFVLDRQGRLFWSDRSPIDVNPGVEGVLDALERLEGGRPAEAGDRAEARP